MTKNSKHLTLDQRIEIQKGLDYGLSFKEIGRHVGKHETTISREVKKHISIKKTSTIKTDKDGNVISQICKSLLKAPFVCNPCKRKHCICSFDKHIYCAKTAQKAYDSLLVSAREGIPLNQENFYNNDKIISQGLRDGQHLHQIMHANNLGVSKSTVYNHAKKGYFSFDNTLFPRLVKFKPRKSKQLDYIPPKLKIGRTYEDFLNFRSENGVICWVEMDTVIGIIGGKAILTLNFTFCNFMLGFLVDNLKADTISRKIKEIKSVLRENGLAFHQFFPVILTDNGTEFADVFSVENDLDGNLETKLFFCDPYKSYQKPKIEKNHTLFRDIVPKGSSFESFNQEIVNKIFSHVNSTARPILMGKTPFEVFTFTFSGALPLLFGIEHIPAKDVVQSPKLLK